MKLPFPPLSTPVLLLSDAPESFTGLGRIGRDLASLLSRMPQFRVGYLGRGGVGRREFPWVQYSYPIEGQWGEQFIAEVWRNFSRGENGIVMSLWDLSRMLWFAQPHTLQDEPLRRFLGDGRSFEKWAYVPVDATGPDGVSLGAGMRSVLAGYDRVLAASEWGMKVMKASGRPDADWIPHGIFPRLFNGDGDKAALGWDADSVYIGCVMTNQARKDWPVAFETAAILRMVYGNRLRMWFHTDTLMSYWNMYALSVDYGVADCIEITLELSDQQLALRYAACDCTMLPSGGEGFGFPIAESLACGTPCVATDYAAGAELVPEDCRVQPVAMRTDTSHNVVRAVLAGRGFAERVQVNAERKRADPEGVSEVMQEQVRHLDWDGPLQNVWMRWMLRGVADGR